MRNKKSYYKVKFWKSLDLATYDTTIFLVLNGSNECSLHNSLKYLFSLYFISPVEELMAMWHPHRSIRQKVKQRLEQSICEWVTVLRKSKRQSSHVCIRQVRLEIDPKLGDCTFWLIWWLDMWLLWNLLSVYHIQRCVVMYSFQQHT